MDVKNKIDTLPASSRVWVYQSSRKFTTDEATALESQLDNFAGGWVSHNQDLKAAAALYYNQFIVLMVDESMAGASGCSIDSSVKFVRQIQQQLGVDFFDRMTFAWKDGEQVKTAHRNEFADFYQQGVINDESIVFDNLVANKADFDEKWLKPLKESWHAQMV